MYVFLLCCFLSCIYCWGISIPLLVQFSLPIFSLIWPCLQSLLKYTAFDKYLYGSRKIRKEPKSAVYAYVASSLGPPLLPTKVEAGLITPLSAESATYSLYVSNDKWRCMCAVCWKSSPRNNQRRVLDSESIILSSANARVLRIYGCFEFYIYWPSWFVYMPSNMLRFAALHTLTDTVNTVRAQLGIASVIIVTTVSS